MLYSYSIIIQDLNMLYIRYTLSKTKSKYIHYLVLYFEHLVEKVESKDWKHYTSHLIITKAFYIFTLMLLYIFKK